MSNLQERWDEGAQARIDRHERTARMGAVRRAMHRTVDTVIGLGAILLLVAVALVVVVLIGWALFDSAAAIVKLAGAILVVVFASLVWSAIRR